MTTYPVHISYTKKGTITEAFSVNKSGKMEGTGLIFKKGPCCYYFGSRSGWVVGRICLVIADKQTYRTHVIMQSWDTACRGELEGWVWGWVEVGGCGRGCNQ